MARKKTSPKKRSTKVIASKGSLLQRLQRRVSQTPALLLAVILVGSVGTYLLVTGWAMPGNGNRLPPEDAARGLTYRGLGLKKATTGPCTAENVFIVEQANENANNACYHIDPGPEGVDIRERVKSIERELEAQATFDEQNLSEEPEAGVPEGVEQYVAPAGTAGRSLSEISGRGWSCPGTGTDGYRVQWLYLYKSSAANRLKDLNRSFVSVAKRVNAVVYNSSQASGNKAQHIRYYTNSSCKLDINAVAISGDIGNWGNITNQLANKGYNRSDRKYILSIDADPGPCGLGSVLADDSASSTNSNNSGPSYAAAWKPCWNYAEPHELAHTLGAVQPTAPRATAGFHCSDQKDVMCYDDGTTGSNMTTPCTSDKKYWMLDCGFNDYYDRGALSGYISSHWNIANSRFLTR